jgi:hypothetical protein
MDGRTLASKHPEQRQPPAERVKRGSHLWLIAACALLLALVVQTLRLRASSAATAEAGDTIRALQLAERTYKRAILLNIMSALPSEAILPSDGIYMIVDRKCGACQLALDSFAIKGTTREVRVASFADDATVTRSWLSDIGLPFDVVDAPLDSTFLDELPQTVTPLFLEFARGEPVDIHIGQPRTSWYDTRPDRSQGPDGS